MAKATATCTCRKCGKTFEKSTTKRNRREADAWEEWAKSHYDLCPSCYGQEQKEAEKAAGLTAEIRLDDTAAWTAGKAEAVCVVTGCGYEYREQLKALGYRYTDVPSGKKGLAGLLADSIGSPKKYWAKRTTLDGINATAAEIIALGGRCQVPSEYDLLMFDIMLQEGAKHQAAESTAAAQKQAEMDAALEALGPCPEYPDDIAAILKGRWNGKVYGNPGAWRIYVSGKETALTDDQKERLEGTREARCAWRDQKAAIEAGGDA